MVIWAPCWSRHGRATRPVGSICPVGPIGALGDFSGSVPSTGLSGGSEEEQGAEGEDPRAHAGSSRYLHLATARGHGLPLTPPASCHLIFVSCCMH